MPVRRWPAIALVRPGTRHGSGCRIAPGPAHGAGKECRIRIDKMRQPLMDCPSTRSRFFEFHAAYSRTAKRSADGRSRRDCRTPRAVQRCSWHTALPDRLPVARNAGPCWPRSPTARPWPGRSDHQRCQFGRSWLQPPSARAVTRSASGSVSRAAQPAVRRGGHAASASTPRS